MRKVQSGAGDGVELAEPCHHHAFHTPTVTNGDTGSNPSSSMGDREQPGGTQQPAHLATAVSKAGPFALPLWRGHHLGRLQRMGLGKALAGDPQSPSPNRGW